MHACTQSMVGRCSCALPSCLEAALWVLESVVQMGRPPDGLQRTICGSLVRKLQVEITVPALLWLLSLVLSSVKLIDIVAVSDSALGFMTSYIDRHHAEESKGRHARRRTE